MEDNRQLRSGRRLTTPFHDGGTDAVAVAVAVAVAFRSGKRQTTRRAVPNETPPSPVSVAVFLPVRESPRQSSEPQQPPSPLPLSL
jgi:hypothetical protein